MLAHQRGLAVDADGLIVTRGAQMAIYLVARALVRPGELVAVEGMGYPPAWDAFRLVGAELAPLPVDGEGLSVDAFEALLARRRVRALYLTPHHQFPTMVALAPARRLALLELARRHRVAIIEDDYDHDVHFEGHPLLPLKRADRFGVVVYIGTLSKVLMPGLRLGYVVAPAPVLERLRRLRLSIDRQGDLAVEYAVAELFEDGEVQRHVRRVRRAYLSRREALRSALRAELGGVVDFDPPPGGLAFWVRCDPEAVPDVGAWARRSLSRGVAFSPGDQFAFDGGPTHAIRVGYARLDERELGLAVRRMAVALRQA